MSAPVYRGCPRCGGGLSVEVIDGFRGLGCLNCNVVVLTRNDLQALMSGDRTEETEESEGVPLIPIDADDDDLHIGPKRPAGVLGIGASIALAILTGIVGIGLGGGVVLLAVAANAARGTGDVATADLTAPPAAAAVGEADEPTLGQVMASDPAALPLDPSGDAFVHGPSEPIAAADPVADPEPVAPVPKVTPPKTTTAPATSGRRAKGSPVDRGWSAVGAGDLAGAQAAFEEGIAADPNNGEANYGVGYVLLKRGQDSTAKTYLCGALGMNVSVDTRREAQGLLDRSGIDCP
jgi:hypothetical protein